VQRVLDVVQRLADAPPPRQMVVELPQMDGLRVMVEARGTTVVLQPVGADASASRAFESLASDVAGALNARGFDVSSSWARDRRRPEPEGLPPAPRGSGRAERPRRAGGLRL
jgi:hypothetical protein